MENPEFAIDEQELSAARRVFEEHGAKAFETYIASKTEEWKKIPLNIGIVGSAGNGKSSYINAIRGIDGDHPLAAKVGVVETTIEKKPYKHPENHNLVFWDLPGVGTPNFPKHDYLDKIAYKTFDFFLLFTSTRFGENDIWLAREINKVNRKFFFVRSKVDAEIANDKRAHPRTHDRDALLRVMRDDIRKNLGELYTQENVFLIDSYEINHYVRTPPGQANR